VRGLKKGEVRTDITEVTFNLLLRRESRLAHYSVRDALSDR